MVVMYVALDKNAAVMWWRIEYAYTARLTIV